MARLSEITEKIKSQDTITGAQAEEQIMLLGAIRDQMKLSNIQLYNINKTMLDTMSAERRNNDKLLLAFRESEMEKKKEELRGTSADESGAPRGAGFGLGDLIIPALLAWQAGLDDVIQAITVVPTILKEISALIGGKLLDGFKTLKALISSSLITPINNIIDNIRNGKFYGSMVDMLTSLKNVLGAYILRPLENIIDTIRKIRIVGPIIDTITILKNVFGAYILRPLENMIEIVRKSKIVTGISNTITILKNAFGAYILRPLENAIDLVRNSKVLASISNSMTSLFTSMSSFLSNLTSAKVFARTLSKLPILNAIFAVYDFMKGFLKGYEEEGLLTGIKEGIFEVIRGVVTKPLDLIKDVASWALRRLNIGALADELDKFSFTTFFDETIVPAMNRFIGNFVTAAVGIIDGIKLLADGDYMGSIKSLLGTSLEFFTNQAKWLYDNFIKGPLSWFFGEDVIKATEQSMKDVLGGAVDFFTNFPQWLYDNTIGPALKMFDGLMTSNENGPNKGLPQKPFQVSDVISNFGKWFYDNTIGPITDFVSSWIPEGGVVAQLEKLLGDSLKIFTDFAGWFHEKFTKPLTELFTTSETPAEINSRIRQGSGGARRGEITIPPRELPRDDRAPVTIGQVIGSVNNTTGASAGSATGNVGVSTQIMPNGFYQLETGGLGLYAIP